MGEILPMSAKGDDPRHRINVAVIEDDPLMRLVIEILLEDDPRFRICWEASSAEEAQARATVDPNGIDLVVLDDVLEGQTTGSDLVPWLTRRWPHARVVMFTADPEGASGRSDVTATVAKTNPELLVPVATTMISARHVEPGVAESRSRSIRNFTAAGAGAPADGQPRGVEASRRPLAPLGRSARWAAVAAVAAALLAASGGTPAPARLVSDLAGFVSELLPERQAPEKPDEPASNPEDRTRPDGVRPSTRSAPPVDVLDELPPVSGLQTPVAEVPAADPVPGQGGEHLPPPSPSSRRGQPLSPPPPASGIPPSTSVQQPPVDASPPGSPLGLEKTSPPPPSPPAVVPDAVPGSVARQYPAGRPATAVDRRDAAATHR